MQIIEDDRNPEFVRLLRTFLQTHCGLSAADTAILCLNCRSVDHARLVKKQADVWQRLRETSLAKYLIARILADIAGC